MFTVAIVSLFFFARHRSCVAVFTSYILFMRPTTERKSNYPVFSKDLLFGDCGMPSPASCGCSERCSVFNQNHQAPSIMEHRMNTVRLQGLAPADMS